MANRKRNIQVKFYVTAEEKELMEQKMAQLQTKRIGAYLRKMAIDGYIIQVDTRDINGRHPVVLQPAVHHLQIGVGVGMLCPRIRKEDQVHRDTVLV